MIIPSILKIFSSKNIEIAVANEIEKEEPVNAEEIIEANLLEEKEKRGE